MHKTVLAVMIFTLLGKLTGFVREIAMAAYIGANAYTDAYQYAITISYLFTSMVLGGINTALIPVLYVAEKDGVEDRFMNRFLTIVRPMLILFSVIVFILAKPLSYLIAPGIEEGLREITVYYSRILSFNLFFLGMKAIWMGYLQKKKSFIIPASMALPLNIGLIAGIMLSSPTNPLPMVIGTVVGHLLSWIWFIPSIRRKNFRYKRDWNLGDPHIKLFISLVAPILLSLAASQINITIDKAFASFLPVGSATYINYATKLEGVIYTVLVASVSTVLFQRQSELAAKENDLEVLIVTRKNHSWLLMIVLPMTLGAMVLSREITTLAYVRKSFTLADAIITGNLLLIYFGEVITSTTSEVYSKMLFSFREAKKPMIGTFISVSVNVIMNFILVKPFGVYGLAMATLTGAIGRMMYIIYSSNAKYKANNYRILSPSMIKYSAASLVMALSVFGLKTLLANFSTLTLVILCFISGVIVYIAILMLMKTPELSEVTTMGKNFLRSQK